MKRVAPNRLSLIFDESDVDVDKTLFKHALTPSSFADLNNFAVIYI